MATILYVEDNGVMGTLTAKTLSKQGHTVLWAKNRPAAKPIIDKHRDEIDLLVLDYYLATAEDKIKVSGENTGMDVLLDYLASKPRRPAKAMIFTLDPDHAVWHSEYERLQQQGHIAYMGKKSGLVSQVEKALAALPSASAGAGGPIAQIVDGGPGVNGVQPKL